MTSVASITPQTAPRDAQALMKLGIFQVRLLIEKLGGLVTNEEKVAFAKMTPEEKANLALQLLLNFDKAGGGAKLNGTAGPAMPAPMPAPAPTMEVAPAALAAAAQATAPQVQAAPPKRTPRTQSDAAPTTAAGDAGLGADILNALNRIIQQNEEQNGMLAGSLKELLGQTQEVAKANHQHAETYKAVYGALQNMSAEIAGVALQTKLAMALVLPLAEQVLGASREDILAATVGDVGTIQQLLSQVTNPGKAG